jgi:hypothetical protein
MDAKEFLQQLDKTQQTFRWEYLYDNRIRGFLKTDPTRMPFDPIAAVAWAKTGQPAMDKGSMEIGASVLGLSEFDCVAILDAADGLLWKQIEGRTVVDGYCEWLRDGIALIVGLEPFEDGRRKKAPRPVEVGVPVRADSEKETQSY